MSPTHPLGDPAELAALYAAGALTHEERADFEAHLAAGCEACRAEVARLNGAVAALASAVRPVPPDPRVREQLLARVTARPVPSGEPTPLRPHLERSAGAPDPGRPVIFRWAAEAVWESTGVSGVSIRVLHVDRENDHFTALVRMVPGASYPRHIHGGAEECLVLEGDLHDGDEVMGPGDYQRRPAGSSHDVQRTENGCLLLITSSLSDVFS